MKTYIFTLKHDNGTAKLKIFAHCLTSAIQAILKLENCPERAITNIKIIDK
jgi:hypothetical protein